MVFIIMLITMFIVGSALLLLVHTGFLPDHISSPNILIPILLFAIISIVIGTMVATMISAIPMKPVGILIQGMNRLSNGEFDTRISLGQSQIGEQVASSFNRLAEDLANTEMLRSDFVNNFSHEFKTPIVSIRGFAKLLQKGNLTEAKQQEYLTIIVDEVSRLADLSTNALQLTKIENQTILTDVSCFNLSEQIRNSILLLEQKWEEKQLKILPDFLEYEIEANEELLKQVWINLIDNAIKFSPEFSTITCSIHETSHDFLIKIKNNGPQILPDDFKRIFNKYWQADASHTGEGAGIGLSIAHRVILLHKGTISVESLPELTTFTILLPKKLN